MNWKKKNQFREKAVDYKQKNCRYIYKIESEKYSNGVKLTKNELEKLN